MGGKEEEIRFIDLFGGVGGFRLGLEGANRAIRPDPQQRPGDAKGRSEPLSEVRARRGQQEFRCVWYCENDKWAVGVYNQQFREERQPTDARRIRTEDLPEFELLCAGFPCQSFSIAGGRKGFEDIRGTLFFEIARILRDRKPPLCLLENVGGLLSHDEGLTFQVVLESLDELGYDAEWEMLNSKNYGVPQSRSRPFIVGYLRGGGGPEIFPLGQDGEASDSEGDTEGGFSQTEVSGCIRGPNMKSDATYVLHNIYGGFGEEWPRTFEDLSPTIRTPKGGGHLPVIAINQTNPHSANENRKINLSDTARSIKANWSAQQQPLLLDDMKIRRFTPIETERLQGFPDDWTRWGRMNGKKVVISDTQRYKMMGNAVTVNVVEAVGTRILEVGA